MAGESTSAIRMIGKLELGVGVGVVGADLCFYDVPTGWLTGVYLALCCGALVLGTPLRSAPTLHRVVMLFAVGLTTMVLLVEPSPLALALALVLVGSLATIARAGFSDRPEVWVDRARRMLRIRAATSFARHLQWRIRHRKRGLGLRVRAVARGPALRATHWLRGWALPIGLSAVFFGLFSAANPIFEEAMSEGMRAAWRGLEDIVSLLSPIRWLFWFVAASLLWIFVPPPVRGQSPLREWSILPDPERVERWTEGPVLARCLALFNLLFAAQNALDLRYLWGGSSLPAGLTYAAYAQRGAYPLVVTTLLAAVLVLIAFRPGRAHGSGAAGRALVILWIAQNLLLTASAAWRLDLYVEVYGLTRLRFAAAVWMGLVTFGLATIAWRIHTERLNPWLVRVNTVALLLVLYGTAFANADARIAWFNVRHSRELPTEAEGGTHPLDIRYLETLGFESIQPLEWYGRHTTDPIGRQRAFDAATELRAELRERTSDWRGGTIRRARALREFESPAQ